MSARVGEAARPGRGAPEARREARGFGEYLEAARRAAGRQAEAAAARRAAGVGEAPEEAGASAGAALSRRRVQSDGADGGLAPRRASGAAERPGPDSRAELAFAAPAPGGAREPAASGGPAPRAADLAAAVERLAVTLERRDRALGPELRLDLGGLLSVSLAMGQKGIEVVFSGEARAARLAEAELPAVLARLRERGVAVERAEVRTLLHGRGRTRPDR